MINTNKIYLGDNKSLLLDIPDNSVDMVLTSPPYDSIRDYDGETIWNIESFQIVSIEIFRVLKESGVLVWIVSDETKHGDESGTSFKQALFFKQLGFKLHDTMIYGKTGFSFPEKYRYPQVFEYMFVFVKGDIKKFNPIKDRKNKSAGRYFTGTQRQKDGSLKKRIGQKPLTEYGIRYNIWIYHHDKNKHNHPAPFPLQLAVDHILSWSNPGDIVLDPFMGSGTTAVACIQNNRQYIGIEKYEKYYVDSLKRIERENKLQKKRLF